ncbi:MAG TPA: hypothetical protein VJ963_00980 [Bacteroidales bacterium]|nr:hypothetical protein [Bacteroidales bacterium]
MKKSSSIILIFTLILLLFGCEEQKDPAGSRGVAIIPEVSDINPALFDSKDLENSYIQFTVTLPEGTQADEVIIQGSYNGNMERVAIDQATSFPATIRILSADAAQMLGLSLADIKNGDVFMFEIVIVNNGLATRSNEVIYVPVACAYSADMATGSYHAVSDWPSENDVTITVDPDDPYTVYVSGLAAIDDITEDNGPYVLHINPVNYAVTTETKTLASDYWGYGAVTYSGDGVFSSCDGAYTLNIDISIGAYGSQGVYTFNLTRND